MVYDAPLKRYIFASWSCTTHEFYEAPQPWGPWRHFLSIDFGALKTPKNYGQYGTSIPSKFISGDGRILYLQSNVWEHSYTFALRKLFLEPYSPASPENGYSEENLARAAGTLAISKSTHYGLLCGLDCTDLMAAGMPNGSEDDFDKEIKTTDWWGYTWPRPYHFNQVVYRTGSVSADGGWFAEEASRAGAPAFSMEGCGWSDDHSVLSGYGEGRLSRDLHIPPSRRYLGRRFAHYRDAWRQIAFHIDQPTRDLYT